MHNFVLQTPSLQHLAAVKTVAALWNHRAILTQIAEPSHGVVEEFGKKWKVIKEKVEANASALELAQVCKQRVLNVIEPLGKEMLHWCTYHYVERNENDQRIFLKCSLPKQFFWTMHGVIDYAKTAELMLKDQSLKIESRYEIACLNCFENEAGELMKLIPEVRLRKYSLKLVKYWPGDHRHLITYFACTLRGDVYLMDISFREVISRGCSIRRYLFLRSLDGGNPAACAYAFQKLTPEEKELVLVEDAKMMLEMCRVFVSGNVLYYLSRMNEEQGERLFRECIGLVVLICLLQWPLQSLFVETLECGRRYMAYRSYEKVLLAIAHKIGDGAQDYDYSQLFRECWRLSSADYEGQFLDNGSNVHRLMDTKREELIKLILNEAPSRQIQILFHQIGDVLLDESVISDAALVKCKEKAALNSSNDQEDKEKRLKSERLSRLVASVMERRIKSREVV